MPLVQTPPPSLPYYYVLKKESIKSKIKFKNKLRKKQLFFRFF